MSIPELAEPAGRSDRSLRTTFRAPSIVLFLCLFAAQASVLVLSPILVEVGRDLGVSTASVGQLRTISGLVAAVTALLLGRLAGHVSLRDLLLTGCALLALGSVLSAVSPTYAVLALAQVPTGVALAILLSAGVAGVAEWAAEDQRARVLSWALVGQASSWIVGMPIIGLVSEVTWRLAFVSVPLAGSLAAALALSGCSKGTAPRAASPASLRSVLREPRAAGWAAGEVLAFSAWAATLVYAGALFVDSYDVSPAGAGVILATGAVAYLPGNFLARRLVERSAPTILIACSLAGAVLVALFGTVRPSLAVSVAIFAGLGFVGGARTLAGAGYGLVVGPQHRLAVMGVRASATQVGYLVGSAAGGLALAVSGYGALGLLLAAFFAGAAVAYTVSLRT
jgi:MFS transporter, DHA1 family, inner membrane transport protein